jgi:hypothetical protein
MTTPALAVGNAFALQVRVVESEPKEHDGRYIDRKPKSGSNGGVLADRHRRLVFALDPICVPRRGDDRDCGWLF